MSVPAVVEDPAPAKCSRPISAGEVLAFASALSAITYLDRVCFGAAAPYLVSDLGLKDVSDLKWAFTLFTVAYAIFEIPSGWLGDTRGARQTLVRIVLGWSLFTALTGLVGLKVAGITLGGVGTLCVIRFLFGVGEAGAYPNMARLVADWFPLEQRGRAKGAIWMAGRFMGGFTPLIWTLLVAGSAAPMSWRVAFVFFGFIGLGWCVAFHWRYRDYRRADDCEPNSAAHAAARVPHALPWRAMLAEKNLWWLGFMYACAAYGWYFNITYFPSFLETCYGVDPGSMAGAVLKGGPLLLGGVGCFVGGMWTDRLLHRLPQRRWARRIPAMAGHGLCAACYAIAVAAESAWAAALAISLAAFSNDLMMGAAWSTCQDVGRRHTAVVAGWMNMLGNLGGALSGWTCGTLLARAKSARAIAEGSSIDAISSAGSKLALSEGYEQCLLSFAIVSAIAVFTWLAIDAEKPLEVDTNNSNK